MNLEGSKDGVHPLVQLQGLPALVWTGRGRLQLLEPPVSGCTVSVLHRVSVHPSLFITCCLPPSNLPKEQRADLSAPWG